MASSSCSPAEVQVVWKYGMEGRGWTPPAQPLQWHPSAGDARTYVPSVASHEELEQLSVGSSFSALPQAVWVSL